MEKSTPLGADAGERHRAIIDTFVEFLQAPTQAGFDAVDFLYRVARRGASLLQASEVGMLVRAPGGELRVMANSNEQTDALELLQTQNDRGPCVECCRSGEPVHTTDLSRETGRWPFFAPAALAAGFAAVQALPMRARDETVGALNIFQTTPGRLSEEHLHLAQALADFAAIGLLLERDASGARRLTGQLEQALESRVKIEQAKGSVAHALDVSVDEAFALMRSHARRQRRRLTDVADDVVARRVAAEDLQGPGERPD